MGHEVHAARLALGLSQEVVGRQVGLSRSKVGRIERGDYVMVPLVELILVAAVVGLEISVRAYPVGAPYRDRAHAALLERLRQRLHPSLQWRTEVPLPNANDLRAWDAMISGADFRVGTEAETRARDGQELERRIAAKQRDGAVDLVLLLLADTRSNRAFVRDRASSLKDRFPASGTHALAALAAGRSPGGNALILI